MEWGDASNGREKSACRHIGWVSGAQEMRLFEKISAERLQVDLSRPDPTQMGDVDLRNTASGTDPLKGDYYSCFTTLSVGGLCAKTGWHGQRLLRG